MHPNTTDAFRILEAKVGPGIAAIGRPIHAVSNGHAVTRVVLSSTQVDNVVIGRRYLYRPERQRVATLED